MMAAQKEVCKVAPSQLAYGVEVSLSRLGIYDHLSPLNQALLTEPKKVQQAKVFKFCSYHRAVSKAIMMHSIVNNTAPEYLTSRFVRGCAACDLTSHNLRENEYKLAVPQPTKFYKRSICYSRSVLWNSLPLEVRQFTSPRIFKGKLRDINYD